MTKIFKSLLVILMFSGSLFSSTLSVKAETNSAGDKLTIDPLVSGIHYISGNQQPGAASYAIYVNGRYIQQVPAPLSGRYTTKTLYTNPLSLNAGDVVEVIARTEGDGVYVPFKEIGSAKTTVTQGVVAPLPEPGTDFSIDPLISGIHYISGNQLPGAASYAIYVNGRYIQQVPAPLSDRYTTKTLYTKPLSLNAGDVVKVVARTEGDGAYVPFKEIASVERMVQ
ncbi:hypothetical protein [Paenilisteria newyorkensis]|uniref:hypothetical protein n=1 Tax=Listeria newyorkensis TaxID=1497681 RepID=UPI000669BEAC|nr:hypothetical protein [Listeria newyorkensis]KMT61512.1 hypothetical protein X559_2175 [Listeria newyorkensis]